MDPKTLSHLDPRARETYDRVMGVATSPDQVQAPQTPPAQPDPVVQTMTADAPIAQMPQAQTQGMSSFTTDGLSTPIQSTPPPSVFSADSQGSPLATPSQEATQPASSFFSSSYQTNSPVTPPIQQQQTDPSFFSNPAPDSAQATQPTSAFAPISQETPPPPPTADTAMVADMQLSQTPVTPYTTPATGPTDISQQQQEQQAAQPAFTQPLPSPADAVQAPVKEASPLLKVLYIIGAVFFFAVYTIFWIKIFNLPFLF